MLPATASCMQAFEVEFDWQICMENAASMERTITEDGLFWQYAGYMELDVSTPQTPDIYSSFVQKQRLSRAVKFIAPRTVSVNMTESTVRIWNPTLVLPNITYDLSLYNDTANGISTVFFSTAVAAPWTFANTTLQVGAILPLWVCALCWCLALSSLPFHSRSDCTVFNPFFALSPGIETAHQSPKSPESLTSTLDPSSPPIRRTPPLMSAWT